MNNDNSKSWDKQIVCCFDNRETELVSVYQINEIPLSSYRPTFNKPMQCERAAAVRTIHSNGNLVSSEKCYQNSMKTDFKIDVKISETLYSLDKGCKCPRVSSRLLQTPPTSLSDTKGDGLSPLVQKAKIIHSCSAQITNTSIAAKKNKKLLLDDEDNKVEKWFTKSFDVIVNESGLDPEEKKLSE